MIKCAIVEDNPTNLALMKYLIVQLFGYPPDCYLNSSEALDSILSGNYDLLIVDYNLPIMNGAELVEQLIVRGKRPKGILLVTAVADLIESELPDAIDKVCRKPFTLNEFRRAIQELDLA